MSAPFSSSTDYEHWAKDWCWRCTHDDDKGCPILGEAIVGRMPVQWLSTHEEDKHYPYHRYVCTAFAERVGDGVPTA